MPNSEATVKSLSKALKILECFSTDEPELGITEISEKLDLYKSNVFNIIATFEKHGYLEQNPDNHKYKLGVKLLQLSYIVSSNINFRGIILPYMEKIGKETGECVYLSIPNVDEGEVIYLDSYYPSQLLQRSISMLGERAPMYCTGIGKAIMAYLPMQTIEKIIAKGLRKFTENTILNKEKLLKELMLVKERGYAIDNMEHEYGVKCIGAPIFNKAGKLFAGLSISGPSLRFADSSIDFFAKTLKDSIQDIQQRL